MTAQCRGAVAMNIRTGELHAITAKATIIATGGLGRVYEPSTNALICTGDGIALAYRAGAPIMDMEMVQIHPTTLKGSGVLITEGARGEGAYLLNKDGERFMEKYAPNLMELASRDVVSRAEQMEIDEGRGVDGCVFLDMRHLGEELIKERLEEIYEIARDLVNIDIAKELLPILPGVHYIMGGVKTDVDGLTPMPGLYSAGEAACVSVHGANRVGANSLLDTLVFGRRAAEHAVPWMQGKTFKPIPESVVEHDRKMIRDDPRPADERRPRREDPARHGRDDERERRAVPVARQAARSSRAMLKDTARALRARWASRTRARCSTRTCSSTSSWATCSTARR